MDLIKVASQSPIAAVAGAIASTVRDHQRAEVQVVGAAAVNQAIKALIIAIAYLKDEGILIAFVLEYVDITIADQITRAIKFVVEPLPKPSEVL